MPHDRSDVDFSFSRRPESHPATPPAPRSDDDEFRILIIADLSGRASRGICDPALATRRPLKIDVDTFDAVLARLGVEVHLPVGTPDGARLPAKLSTLDDFHPDHLFQTLPLFTRLRELHAQLKDPATFAAAASQVRTLLNLPEPAATPATPSAPAPASEASPAADPFAALLAKPAGAPTPKTAGPADELIRKIAAGTSVQTNPEQARLVKIIEDALAAGLRAALRQPVFQKVEAAWRSVHMLTSRLNTDELLKLYVLDASTAEIAADLAAHASQPGSLERSGTYKLLVEQTARTPGGTPWALVVLDETFADTPDDVRLLAQLATCCAETQTPLLAAADPSLVGCPGFDKSPDPGDWRPAPSAMWNKLKELSQSQYLCLALPRLLLRLPYGPDSDPVERYHFNEMTAREHDAYLWGNGAFAVACALAERFLDEGWSMDTGAWLQLGDLPAHTIELDGTKTLQPCAEALLTDRASEAITAAGITPLLSVKHQNAIRLPEIVALTRDAFQGRWGEQCTAL